MSCQYQELTRLRLCINTEFHTSTTGTEYIGCVLAAHTVAVEFNYCGIRVIEEASAKSIPWLHWPISKDLISPHPSKLERDRCSIHMPCAYTQQK